MKISVVTVVYNGYDRFLDRWIECAKRQTVKPHEIIVVLGENCDRYDHDNDGVRFIKHDEHTTMGALRNIGLRETTGDKILYFSADDVLMDNALEEIQNTEGDIIALKYVDTATGITRQTPKIERHKIPAWAMHYTDAAGYVAFRKGLKYEDTDFPNYPLLFDAFNKGMKFNVTENVCAIYVRRGDSHSKSGHVKDGLKEIKKYVKQYF